MSLHKLGDTKSWRTKNNYTMSAKIRGRSIKGHYRSVVFRYPVIPLLAETVQFYEKDRYVWLYSLQCTQYAYKRLRILA